MTARLVDRLVRLEAVAVPRAVGKHLVFKVEAPHGTPVTDIVAFLKGQGHAIHDHDDVFVMNVGAHLHLRDGCSGPELGRRLASEGVCVLFLTAVPALAPEDERGLFGVLLKPCGDARLLRAVAEAQERISRR